MQKFFCLVLLFTTLELTAQDKKPLDHTVYDSWKSIGERMISNDGKFVAYVVNPQEGDGELVIQNPSTKYKKTIARGYNAVITEDSRFLICKIKPTYQEIRQAKIKKKTGDDLPKDSLAIIELGKDSVQKIAKFKSYKTPEKGAGWVAYLLEKTADAAPKVKALPDSVTQLNNLQRMADSLIKVSDSLRMKAAEAKEKGLNVLMPKKETKPTAPKAETEKVEEGTDLVLRNLLTGEEQKIKLATEYYFSKKGNSFIVETSAKNNDTLTKASVWWIDLATKNKTAIFQKFNDAKNYAMDEEGTQLVFVAERDSSSKALTKFYKLWYYAKGNDSATLLADKNTVGMKLGTTVSEYATNLFSKDGKKIFFGTAAIKPPKDTSIVEFETAKLDIWHYNDDYLQTVQLKNVDNELKRSYMAVVKTGDSKIIQLGAEDAENISLVNEGNADWVLAESTKGNRIETQWLGRVKSSAYIISTVDGKRKEVAKNLFANYTASPAGRYVYWYNDEQKNYFVYDVATGVTKNVSATIKAPLYDEEFDMPDFPNEYGVMGWSKDDKNFYVYDRYEVWDIQPATSSAPTLLIEAAQQARKKKITYRYLSTNREERFINLDSQLVFRVFNNTDKTSSLEKAYTNRNNATIHFNNVLEKNVFSNPVKAKNANYYIYTKESYAASPDIYYADDLDAIPLSDINPQQEKYNWLTAELFSWKAYDGKQTQGIVYKPENFDPSKKYPLICYFYEKLTDGLYNYQPPSPTPSRLNIPFFVSRGYVVLAPDIYYTTGQPGKDAFNYIVSGARALVKQGYIDSTKMGLQGQSWGGYQTAYIITKTKLFAAAWAGAPVANMTSAYGGIRWESGANRQFQYERSQSRIGGTLWDKTKNYLESSPLFQFPNVTTPVVVMSNDADGAVPWYQGIEMFTGLRRLGKKVWLLNYNGEAHNLLERRNRKDIQIREQQFFDWLLKGDKPAKWITDGVPATQKGIDWGLKVE